MPYVADIVSLSDPLEAIYHDMYLEANDDPLQGTGSLYAEGDAYVGGQTQLRQTNIDTDAGSFTVGGTNSIELVTTATTAPVTITSAATGTNALNVSSVGQITVQSTDPTDGVTINNTTATPTTVGNTTSVTTIPGDASIGQNLTVAGNFTVNGTTTTIDTETVTVADNVIVINSGPGAIGSDGGLAIKRFQLPVNDGTGDVGNDPTPIQESGVATGGSVTTITFEDHASPVDDYYNGWWVRMVTGTAGNIDTLRKIKDYDGTTKVATIFDTADAVDDGQDFPAAVVSGDSYDLYPGSFVFSGYDESLDLYTFSYTAEAPTDITGGTSAITEHQVVDIGAGCIVSRPHFYNYTALSASGTTLTVNLKGHGMSVGNPVKLENITGLTPAPTPGNYTITVAATDTFEVELPVATTSTSSASATVKDLYSSKVVVNSIQIQDGDLTEINIEGVLPGLPTKDEVTIPPNTTTWTTIPSTQLYGSNTYLLLIADKDNNGAGLAALVSAGNTNAQISQLARSRGSNNQRLKVRWISGQRIQLSYRNTGSLSVNRTYCVRILACI